MHLVDSFLHQIKFRLDLCPRCRWNPVPQNITLDLRDIRGSWKKGQYPLPFSAAAFLSIFFLSPYTLRQSILRERERKWKEKQKRKREKRYGKQKWKTSPSSNFGQDIDSQFLGLRDLPVQATQRCFRLALANLICVLHMDIANW